MIVPKLPALTIRLQPFFDESGGVAHIDIQTTFDARAKKENDVLFYHILRRGPIKTQQYDVKSIELTSANDMVPFQSRDNRQGTKREFVGSTSQAGQQLVAKYRAYPAQVNKTSPCGPQIALEQDGGGLSACGQAFLLLVDDDNETDFEITIEWDLHLAPYKIRAISTWGEGKQVHFHGKPSLLEDAFFMVGPVQSYETRKADSSFGLYWLSNPPFNAHDLGRLVGEMVPQLQQLFEDSNHFFRVFIRRNVYKCVSGRGLFEGFVFAWNDIQGRTTDYTEFIFHELVHNWPRLGFSVGGPTPEEFADGWFNEGIADYYALILPFRLGLIDANDFVLRFNRQISGYYTNPDRHLTNKEVPENFWRSGHANRIPYQRGLMYFLALSYQLHLAGKRSLDDLVREMVSRRRKSLPHDINVWLQLVEAELGMQAREDYQRMSRAELIRLPPDCMDMFMPSAGWTLQRMDQEEFYLGFPEKCISPANGNVVDQLDDKSRAAIAGVRNGDIITQKTKFLFEAEIWDQDFTMIAIRDGKEIAFKWWPRSWTKVESYQFQH